VDELASARTDVLGQSERRRCHRSGRMDDGLQMRVVEVEGVRRDSIEQRRAGHVDALAATEHARLRGWGELHDGGERGFECGVARRANRATEPGEQRALRL